MAFWISSAFLAHLQSTAAFATCFCESWIHFINFAFLFESGNEPRLSALSLSIAEAVTQSWKRSYVSALSRSCPYRSPARRCTTVASGN